MQVTARFGSVSTQSSGRTGQAPPTNHKRLAARRLFIVPLCRASTLHLQTSMPSLGIEPSLYGRDGEPLARVPLVARSTIFWARRRSKQFAF
ncbi:hypothetical protein TNCV_871381 [Trichonephila clavipes]|nr:hypothetical protein TNCV_871381 [Trichonephila clavipes]